MVFEKRGILFGDCLTDNFKMKISVEEGKVGNFVVGFSFREYEGDPDLIEHPYKYVHGYAGYSSCVIELQLLPPNRVHPYTSLVVSVDGSAFTVVSNMVPDFDICHPMFPIVVFRSPGSVEYIECA